MQSASDSTLVRRALRAIMASDAFARSPQARRFLEYVVECTLAGDVDALKAYTIGVAALGVNSERSCPETTARMQASRVRRLLAKYYAREGVADELEVKLPTGSYLARFVERAVTDRSKDRAVGLVVAGFENLSGDQEGELFCRALGDATEDLLVNSRHFRVLRDQAEHPEALRLSGSVARSGPALRVQCTLSSPRGGQTLWSERFDEAVLAGSRGEDGRLLGLQDRIATMIASRVGDPAIGVVARVSREQAPSSRTEAALRAFYRFLAGPTEEGILGAKTALESALPERQGPAPIHAAYSCILGLYYLGAPASRGAELLSSEAHARAALGEDASCSLSHLAKALVHYHHRERASAVRELERAIEHDPAAAIVRAIAGNLLAFMGDWQRGLEWVSEAKVRAPDLPGYLSLAHCIYFLTERGDPSQALLHAEQLDLPGTVWPDLLIACSKAALGKLPEARRAVSRVLAVDPAFPRRSAKYLADVLFLPAVVESIVGSATDAGLLPRREVGMGRQRYASSVTRRPLGGEVPVGILQSLTGTMAISERHLVNAALLAIEEINQKGGVLGRPVRGIVEDGASDPAVFRRKAEKLIRSDGVASIFGCWTSSSRKAVLPVVEAENSILWYPLQYEGLERSRNIVYTGSCLNQQIEPAVRWAMKQDRLRCYLVGSDYVFPRTANRLIRGLVEAAGGSVVGERYEPLGEANFEEVAREIGAKAPDVVYNTVNGSDNLSLFRALARAGVSADSCPVMSFSLSELELAESEGLAFGHLACWSYFQSIETAENSALVRRYRTRYGEAEVLSDPAVTAYAQVHLFKDVVERAGAVETDAILAHLVGSSLALAGDALEMRENNHVQRRAVIGRVRRDQQFEVVWRSQRPIAPQPWLGVDEADMVTRDLVLGALRAIPELAEHNSELEGRVRQPPRLYP